MKNYYRTLGLPMTASENEIKNAFRILVKRFSPDVNPGDRIAAVRFAEINEAYAVLSNVVLRSQYDKAVLMKNDGTVPLTNVSYGSTIEVPPAAKRPRKPVSQPRTLPNAEQKPLPVTLPFEPADPQGSPIVRPKSAVRTPPRVRTDEKRATTASSQEPAKPQEKTDAEPAQQDSPQREKTASREKTLAESIAERAAAVREAYERASQRIAAKREAEKKAREARRVEAEEPRKRPATEQREEPDRGRRATAERDLSARKERELRERVERVEREDLERARREAARLNEERVRTGARPSESKSDDLKARMQTLMSRLSEKQQARSEAVLARAVDVGPAVEAMPAAVETGVAAWVEPIVAVPADADALKALENRFDAYRSETGAMLAELKNALSEQTDNERKRAEEQNATLKALAEEVARLGLEKGQLKAVEEKADKTAALLLAKLNETAASAEAAAAAAALKAAQARQMQDQIDAAAKRLETAIRDLDDAKREKANLQSEMEIETAARKRAESAIEGAKLAARNYKTELEKQKLRREQAETERLKMKRDAIRAAAESERAAAAARVAREAKVKAEAEAEKNRAEADRIAREAAEEKRARMSAERTAATEAAARKRAEELARTEREESARMSREIVALRSAKEKAEARAEEIRYQIEHSTAAADKERLERLNEQQRKNIQNISAKLTAAEEQRRTLEEKVEELKSRIADQQQLDRNIAMQMSDFEQFKSALSESDEMRLAADWETKVRADVMLFKDTLYGTLGVPYYASGAEIADSADRLVERYARRDGDDRFDRIAAVENARDVLTDPERRAAYNREIGIRSSEITAAVKARNCYREIVRKLGRDQASRSFWEGFEALSYDAQTGDAAAQNRLGEAYYDGIEVPADPQQAVFWFKEAAKQLYPAALFNMGICLLNGYGVERDEARGRGFVKKAAQLGHRPAAELAESPEFKRPVEGRE